MRANSFRRFESRFDTGGVPRFLTQLVRALLFGRDEGGRAGGAGRGRAWVWASLGAACAIQRFLFLRVPQCNRTRAYDACGIMLVLERVCSRKAPKVPREHARTHTHPETAQRT